MAAAGQIRLAVVTQPPRREDASRGHMNDATASFTVPTIFGLMTAHSLSWKSTATTRSR